jgi:5-methyltetrahydrofolate--homocysteine methyltransferase
MVSLAALLAERHALLADGATGTNLFEAGLTAGDPPELWNVDFPERIEALLASFVAAGSDIILTNTFGANRDRLKLHKAEGRVFEINKRAAPTSAGSRRCRRRRRCAPRRWARSPPACPIR